VQVIPDTYELSDAGENVDFTYSTEFDPPGAGSAS